MIHKKYADFLNEQTNSNTDINEILNTMLKLPTDEIMEFRDSIKELTTLDEKLNENIISNLLTSLKYKFRSWINNKLWNILINRKKNFYGELLDKLNYFDLDDMSDVKSAFPNFKFTSMYLAGGMDASKQGGKVGWRNDVEYFLEQKYSDHDSGLPITQIYLEDGNNIIDLTPSVVIDDKMLTMFEKKPKYCLNFYKIPAILNPVRKEVDRNKVEFNKFLKSLKTANAPEKDINIAIKFFRKTFNDAIVWGDEKIINNVESIFLGIDKTAGAGTFGELELLSFMEKPLFTWLVNGILSDFKLWNYPQLTKLARNEEEMKKMLNSLYNSYL